MKIIEAMKRIKLNLEKLADLRQKISQNSAHLSYETPLYGDRQKEQVAAWVQSCLDITQENIRLAVAIQRTNLETLVHIELNGQVIVKSISEWVLRRRTYAGEDGATMNCLTDRGLKEGQVASSTGGPSQEIKIVRNFDPVSRDKLRDIFRSEPHLIDSALEIVNATTDLIE